MNIPTILLVLLAGLAPIGIVVSLIVVPSTVKWQPPVIWETQFGTTRLGPGEWTNGITAITADKTALYAVGYVGDNYGGLPNPTPSYVFLKRFDFNGREAWAQEFGNATLMRINAVSVGSEGLYISGRDWANQTTFVEKYDFNGNWVWTRTIQSLGYGYSQGMSVGNSGVYIAGIENGSITTRSYDFNGNAIWTKALTSEPVNGSILVYATSNGVYLAGSNPGPSSGQIAHNIVVDTRAFIARFDANGAQVWNRQFDSPASFECACVPYGLSGDSSGIIVSGVSYDKSLPGGTQFSYGGSFLRRYDWSGKAIWTAGDPGSVIGVISADQSDIYSLEGAGQLAKRDGSNGNLIWSVPSQGRPADLVVGQNGVYTWGDCSKE